MKLPTLAAAAGFALAGLTCGGAKAAPLPVPALQADNGVLTIFGWRRHRHQERYAYYYGYPWHTAPGAYPYRPDYYRPYYYRPYDRHYDHVGPRLRPWHRRHHHQRRHPGHWK